MSADIAGVVRGFIGGCCCIEGCPGLLSLPYYATWGSTYIGLRGDEPSRGYIGPGGAHVDRFILDTPPLPEGGFKFTAEGGGGALQHFTSIFFGCERDFVVQDGFSGFYPSAEGTALPIQVIIHVQAVIERVRYQLALHDEATGVLISNSPIDSDDPYQVAPPNPPGQIYYFVPTTPLLQPDNPSTYDSYFTILDGPPPFRAPHPAYEWAFPGGPKGVFNHSLDYKPVESVPEYLDYRKTIVVNGGQAQLINPITNLPLVTEPGKLSTSAFALRMIYDAIRHPDPSFPTFQRTTILPGGGLRQDLVTEEFLGIDATGIPDAVAHVKRGQWLRVEVETVITP